MATGFRGRSGRTFSAKLKLVQTDEGKWRVDFDEEWATQPREPADGEAEAAAPEADGTGTKPRTARRRKTKAAPARRVLISL